MYLWEKIRPLDPLPADYRARYSNVQAAMGLEALKLFDQWTAETQAHAARITAALSGRARRPAAASCRPIARTCSISTAPT